jgi:glutamate-1-semialdehyde 2,1-aminomutase
MDTDESSLHSALENAHDKYTLRNPRSLKAHQEACIYLPGGNTRSVLHANPFPLTFSSGNGGTLTSLDGHRYKDFLGEYSAGIFGHSNPRIAAAIQTTMSRGWNFGGLSTHEAVLARRVCERFQLGMVRFTNSGTEANTMALAAALAFAQLQSGTGLKRKILVFSNAYHGATLSFPMSIVMELRREGEDNSNGHFPPMATTNLPHDFVFAPFNNIPETQAIIEALIPSANASLSAILVEPVQGAGGCRPASRKFLNYLREVADTHSAILIADEVMTSRLAPRGMCAKWGIRPDLMTLGKWIGGGMSFGAFGGKREIMELFDPTSSSSAAAKLSHAGTFNNNVLSMAAGCVALDICDSETIKDLSALGEDVKKLIKEALYQYGVAIPPGADEEYEELEIDSFDESSHLLAEKVGTRMFVTGHGSLVNVRFHGGDADMWQGLFYHHMLEQNIYLATRGYMALTLETTNEDVNNLVKAVTGFVRRYSSDLKKSS